MAFLGRFQQYVQELGPWFVHGRNTGAMLEALGALLDGAETALDLGLRFTQPLRCDTSALPVLAKDRGLRIYPAETIASQRLRLANWLPLHRQRGTHQGELRHLQMYFTPAAPKIRIVHQSGLAVSHSGAGASATWHTLDSAGNYSIWKQSPSNWNFDGQREKWSRFWVILYPPSSYPLAYWNGASTTYDQASYYDVLSTGVATDIVSILQEWKAAHSRLAGVIIATDPDSFDPYQVATGSNLPTGNWADWHARPSSAIWVYEDLR